MAGVACTSSTGGGVGQEAPLGAPCDPAAATPCAPIENACSIAVCDPGSRRCKEELSSTGPCTSFDGGAEAAVGQTPRSVDGGVSAPCANTSDCAAPLICLDGACFD
jgi:hypothetical protein